MSLKNDIHRQYEDLDLIEVEAPEFPRKEDGEPQVIRFKRRFTTDEYAYYTSRQRKDPDFNPMLVMFRLLARGEDGRPLVDPNEDGWYRHGTDGVAIEHLMVRSGVFESAYATLPVNDEFSSEGEDEDEGEGKPQSGTQ